MRLSEGDDVTEQLVDFLPSEAGRRFHAEAAAEAELPLIEGVEPREGLQPLDGPELERTLQLPDEVGFTA